MKIFAIGGGENGRNGTPYEIKKFDEEIVELSGKEKPRLLFIGFAQKEPDNARSHYDAVKRNFSDLGCFCSNLEESELTDEKVLQEKIRSADIIFVAGGNTLRLMNIFRKYGLSQLLKTAGENGTVLCGISAGAICWHSFGNSDSRSFTSNSTQLIKVTGLGFIPALYCPHYDVEVPRQADLIRMMKTTKGVALAFDNCCALKVDGDRYEVVKSKESAMAWKCYWQKGRYFKIELKEIGTLSDLVSKENL